MNDLLPCPFCGGEAARVDNGPTKEQMQQALSWGGDADDGGSFIHCTRCDASTALHFDRRENLVSSWNERSGQAAISEYAERIVSDWMCGESIDRRDIEALRNALGMEAAP